jgi:hypothetical protein
MSEDTEYMNPAHRALMGKISPCIKYMLICERKDCLAEAHDLLLSCRSHIMEGAAYSARSQAFAALSDLITNRITELNDQRIAIVGSNT